MIDAIVVPQGAEYKAVYRAISKSQNFSLPIISIPMGFNHLEAEAKITQLKASKIKQLVIMGLCGSLSKKYSVGDIVIYQSCFDPQQQIALETDSKLTTAIHHKISNTFLVKGLTSDRVINLASEKKQLYLKYETDVVDMEGFNYLKLLQNHNIAVAIIRIVSDDIKHDLPNLNQVISDRGDLKVIPLTITMLKQPFAAIQLIKSSLQGLKNLEKVVQNLII